MARASGKALQQLRRNRRAFGWVMVALLVIPLANALGQCVLMDVPSAQAPAPTGEQAPAYDAMPCADCSIGGGWRSLDRAAPALAATLKPWFVFALIVVSTLLALAAPKSISLPRAPLLPVRPRTLVFCVLRL